MTDEELRAEYEELTVGLRHWETKIWMRHAEAPMSLEYANNCLCCKGTGRGHFCLVAMCDAEMQGMKTHECLHPTPEELKEYSILQGRMADLQNAVRRSRLSTMPPALANIFDTLLPLDRKGPN